MTHADGHPVHVIAWEDDAALMAVSCPKCREVAFYGSPEAAVSAGVHHAGECGNDKLVIFEVLPPDPQPSASLN